MRGHSISRHSPSWYPLESEIKECHTLKMEQLSLSMFNLLLLLIISSKFCVVNGFTWTDLGMHVFTGLDINCSNSEGEGARRNDSGRQSYRLGFSTSPFVRA